MTSAVPGLSISATPRSVAEARQWVVETCHSIDRDDVVECAELAVSELVTNAILHGRPPLSIHLGGTSAHPRFEVSDGSRTPPQPPTVDGDEELLTTIGRGLRLVALCSEAWGAQIGAHGKTVWFVPATEPGAAPDHEPQIAYDEGPAVDPAPVEDPVEVRILGLPVRRYREYRRHLGELRRELRLLALAHETDYPMAGQLSDLLLLFERSYAPLTTVLRVRDHAADEAVDTVAVIDRDRIPTVAQLLDMLDLADEFARSERLLAVAPSAAQKEFTRWYLGEFVRQGRGQAPVAWVEPVPTSPRPPRPRTSR